MWYSKKWTRDYCVINHCQHSLTCNKKAEKAVSTLTVTDLHKDTGLKALIASLDNAFQDEVAENVYSTCWFKPKSKADDLNNSKCLDI